MIILSNFRYNTKQGELGWVTTELCRLYSAKQLCFPHCSNMITRSLVYAGEGVQPPEFNTFRVLG